MKLTHPSGAFPRRGEVSSSAISSAVDSSECSATDGTYISSSDDEDESSIGISSAAWQDTTCFVRAIEEAEKNEETKWRNLEEES